MKNGQSSGLLHAPRPCPAQTEPVFRLDLQKFPCYRPEDGFAPHWPRHQHHSEMPGYGGTAPGSRRPSRVLAVAFQHRSARTLKGSSLPSSIATVGVRNPDRKRLQGIFYRKTIKAAPVIIGRESFADSGPCSRIALLIALAKTQDDDGWMLLENILYGLRRVFTDRPGFGCER